MDTLLDAYREEDEDEEELALSTDNTNQTPIDLPPDITTSAMDDDLQLLDKIKQESNDSATPSEEEVSGEIPKVTLKRAHNSEEDEEEDDEDEEDRPPKKQKDLSSLTPETPLPESSDQQNEIETTTSKTKKITKTSSTVLKKSKKKNNNVWTKPTSRKGKKKGKTNNNHNAAPEDTVMITPVPRFPDKGDDTPDMKICLSKAHKAEKVELGDERLSAGSTKGYRMVRATRGVAEGAWYFEIKVVKLGETGHTRLGWSTDKGDLQAPVGYDSNSFGYRDIDGSKIHKAMREKYGEEGYKEGDVIGFYINLPNGAIYMPKPLHLVWFKGNKYASSPEAKEEPPKVVPGSEISFFKNGVCQGIAFSDLFGGRYYPAASMYTLPNQPNCVVKFNFGPDFDFFPEDFEGRPVPKPMIEVPYHGYESRIENGILNEKKQLQV